MKFTKSRKGVTLIEVLFVLGISAVILGLVMTLFSQSAEKAKIQSLRIEIGEIIQCVNSLTDSATSYTGITSQTIAQSGQIDRKYIDKSGTYLTSPYGGPVTLQPYGRNNGTLIFLDIKLIGLSRVACELVAVQGVGSLANSTTITGMQIDNVNGFTGQQVVQNCLSGNVNYIDIRLQH